MSTEERDALAARYFPQEWARVATKAGASKARQKLRRAAEDVVVLDALRAAGARCETCRSFMIGTTASKNSQSPWCTAHSEWNSYAIIDPDDLCVRWCAWESAP